MVKLVVLGGGVDLRAGMWPAGRRDVLGAGASGYSVL